MNLKLWKQHVNSPKQDNLFFFSENDNIELFRAQYAKLNENYEYTPGQINARINVLCRWYTYIFFLILYRLLLHKILLIY